MVSTLYFLTFTLSEVLLGESMSFSLMSDDLYLFTKEAFSDFYTKQTTAEWGRGMGVHV